MLSQRSSSSSSSRLVIACILVVFAMLAISPVAALRETLKINRDIRSAIHVRSFGFTEGGRLELAVRDFSMEVPRQPEAELAKKQYKVAFVIERSTEPTRVDSSPTAGSTTASGSRTAKCFHQELRTEDADIIDLQSISSWKETVFEKKITVPGNYHIYFSNCVPSSTSSFSLFVQEWNVDASGNRNFLSVGEQPLVTVYAVFAALGLVQLIGWSALLIKKREDVKAIHILMAVVLVFKVAALLFEALKFYALQREGSNNGWAIAFYVFNTIRGFLMFAVIALIGTGWSYLKPFLTDRDKQIILAVLVVQLLVNIAWVYVDVASPGTLGWVTWQDIFHLMDMLCCVFIVIPIVWSIRHLKRESERDGRLAASFQRLKNFRSFYLMVIVYIYFTRIVVFLLSTMIGYEYVYVSDVFREGASLLFFFFVGSLFRPQSVNPYLALEGVDDSNFASSATATEAEESAFDGGRDIEMADTISPHDDFDDDPLTEDAQQTMTHVQVQANAGVAPAKPGSMPKKNVD